MNITVSQLPEDYVHPSGKPEGGYWGLFVDGTLMLTEQQEDDVNSIKTAAQLVCDIKRL